MRVILANAALIDLRAIGDYIGERNPDRSLTFVAELRKSCEDLGSMPHAFPMVPGYEHKGIRRRTHKSYVIFYRVLDGVVQVMRVVQGSRDLDRLLRG